ncbi:hypothetical protein Syun_016089 [Stephania yunnanensis]|uniref:Aspartate aminotransferase n=1 Tax=Stephania yunnanensis TaxID=152371 RepID=A0AAP0J6S2_9MAGN
MWRNLGTKRSISKSRHGWWRNVPIAPKDPILGVTEAFIADTNPNKINLGVGSYRDDDGKPVVLQCVSKAAALIDGEFQSGESDLSFVTESVKLAYGENSGLMQERRVAGVPALSGTGACRLFAEFQRRFQPESSIYLPMPTCHHMIWRDALVPQRTYRYYDFESKRLHFAGLMNDVKNAPERSLFLLHPCAHNPTGIDPSEEQWREISHLFQVKKHFPFFDMAYQGFATGDLQKDTKALRVFLNDGHLIGCAQSFTKNMGLSGQRVGCLSILCADERQAIAVKSQLHQIARAIFSKPPVHGALLVSKILSDPDLKALWVHEVKGMVDRISGMRTTLHGKLEKLGSSVDWKHIVKQIGMFCYSGLKPEHVDRLAREFHIYMTYDGRLSMAGVTNANVDYLANALHEVTKSEGVSSLVVSLPIAEQTLPILVDSSAQWEEFFDGDSRQDFIVD